jgi:hypothetical protein
MWWIPLDINTPTERVILLLITEAKGRE